jgi:hypothetical protein
MNSNKDLTNEIGYIYKITAPNGAVYIGQTICVKKRKYQYKKLICTKQTKLYNSCKKYNWNPSDTFEIIDECICGKDKCFLNEKEIYWISYYDSFNNGLNCTEGGKGQVGRKWTEEQKNKQSELINEMYEKGEIPIVIRKGHKLTQEHISKIIESKKEYLLHNEHWNKGKTLSDEHKEKISNSVSGESNGFYGKKHNDETRVKMKEARAKQVITEETKKKMSEAHLKRDKSNDRKHTVSVLQYDMNGNFLKEFSSVKEAAESVSVNTSCIIRVCKGIRKSSGNFLWEYKNV